MYNGVGLSTPRGSGTNGFIQRNLSHVKPKSNKFEETKKPSENVVDIPLKGHGNTDILLHECRRKIEVKCVEMREMMEEEGYDEEIIAKKVEKFRQALFDRETILRLRGKKVDKQNAEIQAEMRNRSLREALGIGEFGPSAAKNMKNSESEAIKKSTKGDEAGDVEEDDDEEEREDNSSDYSISESSSEEEESSDESNSEGTAGKRSSSDDSSSERRPPPHKRHRSRRRHR